MNQNTFTTQNEFTNPSTFTTQNEFTNPSTFTTQNESKNSNTSTPQNLQHTISSFRDAHGKIPYNMTNDYMFRAVLQSNNKVLRGLVCSLLHLEESDVRSVEITNGIVLGEFIKDKEIRLDINVILNNDVHINLEMQVTNELNWPDRSVLYTCRSFDQLNHGQKYIEIKPVIHIGFLDYTLFRECPEFYATYKLINVNNHHVYSDKMTLSVVDLSRIDLATDVDKEYHIDKWAALFKATTWEDLKMIAANNTYLNEASQTIYHMNSDEWIRKVCQDREEYYLDIQAYNEIIAGQKEVLAMHEGIIEEQKEALAMHEGIIEEQKEALAMHEGIIAEQKEALAEKEGTIAEQKEALAEKEGTIEEQKEALAEKEGTIEEQKEALAEKDDTIAEQENIIRQLKAENELLRKQK